MTDLKGRLVQEPRSKRGFHLTVQPDGEGFGVTLFEVDGTERLVSRARPPRTLELTAALRQALKDSGLARTVLSSRRKAPVMLAEDAGVRLALALLATDTVRKGRRKLTMLSAIEHLATEEAYYWYAKCTGADGARVIRALRLFLAEE